MNVLAGAANIKKIITHLNSVFKLNMVAFLDTKETKPMWLICCPDYDLYVSKKFQNFAKTYHKKYPELRYVFCFLSEKSIQARIEAKKYVVAK